MDSLINETLEKIKEQNIKPEPRWKYLLRKYAKWILFLVVLALASSAFLAGYANVSSLDWSLYRFAQQNKILYTLSLVPYFWLILLAIFLGAAFFEIRKTELGYRYSRNRILFLTIAGFIFFGVSGIFFGIGHWFNTGLSQNFPAYSHSLMMTKETQWMQPQSGFLSGTIKSVNNENVSLEDFSGHDWNVAVDEKTLVRPAVDLATENQIKIIGTQKTANDFSATEIRPWNGNGMGRGMQGGGMNRDEVSGGGVDEEEMPSGGGMMRGR